MSNYDSSLTVRTNSGVKDDAKKIYSDLGLDLSTAINVFLRKSIEYEGFPFEVRKVNPNRIIAAAEEADVQEEKTSTGGIESFEQMVEDYFD